MRYSSQKTVLSVARAMLRGYADIDITIGETAADTAIYKSSERKLNISDRIANHAIITGLAVTLHECGHAIMHHRSPVFTGMIAFISRTLIKLTLPALVCVIAGLIMRLEWLCISGMGVFCTLFIWNILTVFYEAHASKFAGDFLRKNKILTENEQMVFAKLTFVIDICAFAGMYASIMLVARVIGMFFVGREKPLVPNGKPAHNKQIGGEPR
jgi:Zn-dependent membrane protease YugP